MSDVDDAHRHSSRNSALLADSAQTALRPRCGIDSVIADRSGDPITKAFLDQMHARWF
ncbi:hypothetical protein ACNQVK_07460 [Mycobacterium sp. 134]|uniref:hypothetical protein n=1 Tax=Mycobacterium sp. 134 TaxID=3400425 RepID=UPI003AAF0B0F